MWTAVAGLSDQLSVTFPDSPRFPVFASGERVDLVFEGNREVANVAGELRWSIRDYLGNEVNSGEIVLSKGERKFRRQVTLRQLPAGYFELRANISGSEAELPRRGSRPAGIATFGVLPKLKALKLAHPDESRFGIQGTNFIKSGVFLQGNPFDPMYQALGVRWVNALRDWATAEPERPGQFAASLPNPGPMEHDFIPEEGLAALNCVAYLPLWALKTPGGMKIDQSDQKRQQAFPPKDLPQYAKYLTTLADYIKKEQVTFQPEMRANYYQMGWEPDWHWKGTDKDFVEMYQVAYEAIKKSDPDAVVLGPGYGVLKVGIEHLERLLPMGLDKALDGIAIHGYYLPFGDPTAETIEGRLINPSEGGTIKNIRKLRKLMAKYFPPEAKLFQTEWGLDYRAGYSEMDLAILPLQAAYVIRGHILFLGEHCDLTFLFYTADYGEWDKPFEDGYGLCFNLMMPQPSYGALDVSPKPVFMGASAMTRVLEGTTTIGPLKLENPAIRAYAFDRAGQTVVAYWSLDDKPHPLNLPVEKGQSAKQVDFVGVAKDIKASSGQATVSANMFPHYLMGVDRVQLNLEDISISALQ